MACDRNSYRRAFVDELQIDDVSQDREMLSALVALEHHLEAIGDMATDPDSVRDLAAQALRIVREWAKPIEVGDLARHKLRGELAQLTARESVRSSKALLKGAMGVAKFIGFLPATRPGREDVNLSRLAIYSGVLSQVVQADTVDHAKEIALGALLAGLDAPNVSRALGLPIRDVSA